MGSPKKSKSKKTRSPTKTGDAYEADFEQMKRRKAEERRISLENRQKRQAIVGNFFQTVETEDEELLGAQKTGVDKKKEEVRPNSRMRREDSELRKSIGLGNVVEL